MPLNLRSLLPLIVAAGAAISACGTSQVEHPWCWEARNTYEPTADEGNPGYAFVRRLKRDGTIEDFRPVPPEDYEADFAAYEINDGEGCLSFTPDRGIAGVSITGEPDLTEALAAAAERAGYDDSPGFQVPE